MPKMNPAQRDAARAARQETGGDADSVADSLVERAADPNSPLGALQQSSEINGAIERHGGLDALAAEAHEESEAPVAPAPRARRKPAPAVHSPNTLFASLDDIAEFLNVLYWGREGQGKTTDVLSAANLGRVLVVNAEGGIKRRPLQALGINTDNIQVYPRPGEELTYAGLQEAMLQVKSDLMDDPHSWFAVIWDSLSEVSTWATASVSDDRVAKARLRGANVDLFDSFFVDRSDYGTSGKMLRNLLRLGRDLQCHFLVTALERRDVDDDTSKVTYGPAVPPGLQSDVLGYMDLVLQVREPDEDRDFYRAQTKRSGRFRSKDRLGALPPVMVEPTFERVVAYVDDELSEATDPVQAVQRELAAEAEKKAEEKATKTATRGTRAQRRTSGGTSPRPSEEATE